MKEVTITSVGVGSLAKLFGVAQAFFAIIIGIVAAIVTTVGVVSNGDYSVLQDVFIAIGIVIGYVVVLPLFAFLVGLLQGTIVSLVWNIVLGASKGLDIEMTENKK